MSQPLSRPMVNRLCSPDGNISTGQDADGQTRGSRLTSAAQPRCQRLRSAGRQQTGPRAGQVGQYRVQVGLGPGAHGGFQPERERGGAAGLVIASPEPVDGLVPVGVAVAAADRHATGSGGYRSWS